MFKRERNAKIGVDPLGASSNWNVLLLRLWNFADRERWYVWEQRLSISIENNFLVSRMGQSQRVTKARDYATVTIVLTIT
jgi:hypothetical protein